MTSTMGGSHLHTPSSIFQHMMGQQDTSHQPGSWMQMPQVPSISIPWSVPALQQPELIRFTGEKTQPSCSLALHQKRKFEDPDMEMRQSKQFISEEKMAARFQDMHISSDYHPQKSTSSALSTCIDSSSLDMTSNTELNMESGNILDMDEEKNEQPRLVMSEELKHLKQEPIIPSSLLSKLERPSMALVLWEPPSKHLRALPIPRETATPRPRRSDGNNNSNGYNNVNSNNNNNESIPDLNQVQSNNDSIVLEPMDL